VDEKLSRPNTKAGRLQRECLPLYHEHLLEEALPTSDRRRPPVGKVEVRPLKDIRCLEKRKGELPANGTTRSPSSRS
jgi:hypothetical protein